MGVVKGVVDTVTVHHHVRGRDLIAITVNGTVGAVVKRIPVDYSIIASRVFGIGRIVVGPGGCFCITILDLEIKGAEPAIPIDVHNGGAVRQDLGLTGYRPPHGVVLKPVETIPRAGTVRLRIDAVGI